MKFAIDNPEIAKKSTNSSYFSKFVKIVKNRSSESIRLKLTRMLKNPNFEPPNTTKKDRRAWKQLCHNFLRTWFMLHDLLCMLMCYLLFTFSRLREDIPKVQQKTIGNLSKKGRKKRDRSASLIPNIQKRFLLTFSNFYST